MQAITGQFILPVYPVNNKVKSIYPWDPDALKILYAQLYQRAVETGYKGTLEKFSEGLGEFLSMMFDTTLYEGAYQVTPMANVEQILRTAKTILEENIVVEKIPYYETSNLAGGYTVIIG